MGRTFLILVCGGAAVLFAVVAPSLPFGSASAEQPRFDAPQPPVDDRPPFEAAPPEAPEPEVLFPPPLPPREKTLRETAAESLARIGVEAIPGLVEALRDPQPVVRYEAARALSRIGPEAREAVPALVRALQDPDPDVRKMAARALGQVGPAASEAIPALLELLRAPNEPPAADNARDASFNLEA